MDPPQRERLKTLIANSKTDQKIYKTGYLNKTGRKGNRGWKRRYFLLSETALAYFTEESTRASTTLKGGVLLTTIDNVRHAEGHEAVRPYIFLVVTPMRTYTIQAATETQRAEWVDAIRKAAEEAKQKLAAGAEGGGILVPQVQDSPPVKIVYFPMRGRPERLRLLLADVGVDFVNASPQDTPGGWPALKKELLAEGLQGTLPLVVLRDGTRMTQNVAAIRHLARVHNRYGASEEDARRSDMVADVVEDWRREFDPVAYNPGWLKDADAVQTYAATKLPERLRLFETMLSTRDLEYIAGNTSATYADFMVFDCLDCHLQIDDTVLDPYPRLRDFYILISSRKRIAKYMASRPASDFAGKEASLSGEDRTASM